MEDVYISYKHIISSAKDAKNDGLCIEMKFFYKSKNGNEESGMDNDISSFCIVLSKGNKPIAKIEKSF